jgi:hypothetical protein
MELTKRFSPDQFRRALESWAWLDLEGKTPVLATLFGDVFFELNGSYWFLDTVEGTLTSQWSTGEMLQGELNTEEGQDKYLLGGLAMAADRAGLTLGPDQVYDFKVPPILGGQFALDNILAMDFEVSVHIAGQLLRQVKSLPPGTKITGFTVDGQLTTE